ncbi:MAG: hypothetical protein ACC660_01700 [Acidimicrobiales bacterium]
MAVAPDEVDIEGASAALRVAAVQATPAWVRRCVGEVAGRQRLDRPEHFETTLDEWAQRAAAFVDTRLGELLGADIDRQQSTPLEIFRQAVRFPVEILHGLGATPVHRGDMARWAFPNDPFDITPGNLSDIGEGVQQAGIVWGASKAALHLARRRREGGR